MIARERAPVAPATRLSSRLAAALALAAVLAGGAIGFIETARPQPRPAALVGAAEVARAYAALPQRGQALGRADAPVTMAVYLDPQCPYCGEWERTAMPELVARFVRTGMLRVEVRGLRFVGPDSDRALRLLHAAALQDRFFQATAILYRNQGEENTGWVSDGYLRSLAASVPGADAARLLADRDSPAVDAGIAADERAAAAEGVTGTPSVYLGRTGGPLGKVELTALDASAVAPAIRQLAREARR
ncbi:MAG TPA: thioredoxin domain-containing protein [Gaiellaceae bacterium]|nr:thioredoxin domain-containing protein [Gaiellaceae bacterium]